VGVLSNRDCHNCAVNDDAGLLLNAIGTGAAQPLNSKKAFGIVLYTRERRFLVERV
jgi:hypothetical protein